MRIIRTDEEHAAYAIYLTAIRSIMCRAFLTSVVMVFVVKCVASMGFPADVPTTKPSDAPATQPSNEVTIGKLTYKQLAPDAILITKGFVYRSDENAGEVTLTIQDIHPSGVFVTEGSLFEPLCIMEEPEKWRNAGGLRLVCDSVGVTWVFAKADLKFVASGVAFRSIDKGATVRFQKDGILVRGFQVVEAKQ